MDKRQAFFNYDFKNHYRIVYHVNRGKVLLGVYHYKDSQYECYHACKVSPRYWCSTACKTLEQATETLKKWDKIPMKKLMEG